MKEITLCLTSCNRWSLLEKTIDSFLRLNKYPIKEYLLHEDSNNEEMFSKIQHKYGHLFKILRPENNVGLLKSIDNKKTDIEKKENKKVKKTPGIRVR